MTMDTQSLELYNLVTNILDGTNYSVSYTSSSIVIHKKGGTSLSIKYRQNLVGWLIKNFTVDNVINLKNYAFLQLPYPLTGAYNMGELDKLKRLLEPISYHLIKKAHMFNI